ncbi:MAG: AbrB/MazE/SpoVT family DNA-binding domain-containing protein [Aquificaceae bacterium]|nr:AbrB/MazE/SpoVT family DNA-binding domain-containing protein [Aquificaceae bacterium]MCS7197001.1 AbrB/MazE/SpoVT family DNA-binding domain-containing protein [Aquificaceae bacterium]MCX7989687.1 AbrB/MazE/SpoVT family DNA-binding domain-containing protein [Aquificaceae bacterium]MDW8032749.1 AbrB/MazE/SpoVT family DNA-binding domain-containing protein [Aquificaceae bacterium]MDW8294120.1 AbrB/MazE/SpoVT family DNA-binding domain-containing protein [Aquificaceae bacterium]
MDEVAKVMARGLIALPSDVRKRLGLKEGDLVKIEVKEDQLIIRKEQRVYDLKGSLPPQGQGVKTFAQILAEEFEKQKGGR